MKRNIELVIVLTSLAILFPWGANCSRAGPINPPSDLPHSAPYQLVFVTAGTHDATSADIDDYNEFVTEEAARNPDLPTDVTWWAVASTPDVDACANVQGDDNVPIYNTQGQLVAHGIADLWDGTLENAVRYDQFGADVGDAIVWTGSNSDGTRKDLFGSLAGPLGSSFPYVIFGAGTVADRKWLDRGALTDSSELHSLYALSGPMYIVPEPGALVLLGIAAAALAFCRRLPRFASADRGRRQFVGA